MKFGRSLHWLNTLATVFAVFSGSGCGSSSSGTSGGGSGGGTSGQLGDICTAATAASCAGGVCLVLTANDRNISGLCSAECSASTCGNNAVCVAETNIGQSVCFRECAAAADCAQGVPCTWSSEQDAGVCTPVPTSICTQLAAQGGCDACIAANCCNQAVACGEDVTCAKLEASCPGNAACQAMLQASSDSAAQAAGACVAANCATQCP